MPRKYKRKPGVQPREIKWTKGGLEAALFDLNRNVMGLNQISRLYGIPARTLRRRQKANNSDMVSLGKHPILGLDNEKRLVNHIKKLEAVGFPPDRQTIRMLAFQFAEKLKLNHSFNRDTQMAGHQWLQSFLERNKELSIRVAEGLSVARAQGLNRKEVGNFYDLLLDVLTKNDLLDKPERIYNMDETGIQLNNKPGKVLASKGSRAVKMVTSAEKGETITVIGCCNAVGNFLPPVVILKGVNKKPEFHEGLPQGSKVFMNRRSAYVNTELFKKWLMEHFVPNKPEGKVLLILDGHTSHSSAVDMLEAAETHQVILLCLPSHTTSALQPLDRAVYKPFKSFFAHETNHFMRTNPHKKLSRSNSATLIGKAWLRAATASNALAGFRGSGIFPLDPTAIPDYEFEISDKSLKSQDIVIRGELPAEDNIREAPNLACEIDQPNQQARPSAEGIASASQPYINEFDQSKEDEVPSIERDSPSLIGEYTEVNGSDTDCEQIVAETQLVPLPGKDIATPVKYKDSSIVKTLEFTPSKFLLEDSPIPKIPLPLHKRGKQSAEILNSKSKIEKKKVYKELKSYPNKEKQSSDSMSKTEGKKTTKGKHTKGLLLKSTTKVTGKENLKLITNDKEHAKKRRESVEIKCRPKRKKPMKIYSSSDEEANEDVCCVCLEDYLLTKSKVDWIQCTACKNWLHETCTIFRNYCKKCGELKALMMKM